MRARQVELQVSQALGLSLDVGAAGAVDAELELLSGARTAVATGRDLLVEADGDRLLARLATMLEEAEHTARALEALLTGGSLEGRMPLPRVVAIWVRAAAFQLWFLRAALRSSEQRGAADAISRYQRELAEAEEDRRVAEGWVDKVAHHDQEAAWFEIFERARLLPRRLRQQVAEIDEVISLCRTYIRRKKRASGEAKAAVPKSACPETVTASRSVATPTRTTPTPTRPGATPARTTVTTGAPSTPPPARPGAAPARPAPTPAGQGATPARASAPSAREVVPPARPQRRRSLSLKTDSVKPTPATPTIEILPTRPDERHGPISDVPPPLEETAGVKPPREGPRLEPLITPKAMPAVVAPEVDPLADELFEALQRGPMATIELLQRAGPRLDAEVLRQFLGKHAPREESAQPAFLDVMRMLAELLQNKVRPRARCAELAYQLLFEVRRLVSGELAGEVDIALAGALLCRPSTDRSEDAERAALLLEPMLSDLKGVRQPRVLLRAAEAAMRRRGDRSENLERGLQLTERVLELTDGERTSNEWLSAQQLRGDAFRDRARGKRAENLEEALRCYREALGRARKDEQLDVWARSKLGVGLCYALRQTGDPKDNQLRAIENLSEAVGVLEDSARIELALGRLHLARLLQRRGQEADLGRIGELYEQALRVFTARDYPNEFQLCHDGIELLRRPRR